MLRALFKFAMNKRRRWMTSDPPADVDLPRRQPPGEIKFLTVEELWRRVDAARPGRIYLRDRALYLVGGQCVLRIGEIQALDWPNVDFANGKIRVRRTWDRKAKRFTAPKSRHSIREIDMSDDVVAALRALCPDVMKPEGGLVFDNPDTGEPQGWRLLYDRLRESLEAGRARHDARVPLAAPHLRDRAGRQ